MKHIIDYILIIAIIGFLIYDVYKQFNPIIEGVTDDSSTYTDPNLSEDPVYMAKVNASNITYIKSRLDEITTLRTSVESLQSKVDSNSVVVQGLTSDMQTSGEEAVPDQQTTSDLADTANTIEAPGST